MNAFRCLLLIALMAVSAAAVAEPEAKKSFEQLEALAGTWEVRARIELRRVK